MKSILSILLFLISIKSQTIEVNIVINTSVIDSIEHQLVKDVFALWNRRTKILKEVYWKRHRKFSGLMKYMSELDNSRKDEVIALSSITITKERQKQFNFSTPYVPIREVLISKSINKKANDIESITNKRVGANLGTTQEVALKLLEQKMNFKPVYFSMNKHKHDALINDEIDFYIDDNINVWSDSRLKIVFEFENQPGNGYGLMFHKESSLKKIIDPMLIYYMRSAKFRKITTEKFGKKISDYFVKKISNF